MSDDEKGGFDWSFSNRSVDERLRVGREQMEAKSAKKPKGYKMVPKDERHSGHMDDQLFPGRKPPYHE